MTIAHTIQQERTLFLDIDGVLNGHDSLLKGVSISPSAVAAFNRVIAEAKPNVVLSSAWRYMIHGGAMTLRGFGYLLKTHGVIGLNLIDLTPKDEEFPERGEQILAWREVHNHAGPYVVVDDEDFQITKYGHPLIRTDGQVGMTMADAERIIAALRVGQ